MLEILTYIIDAYVVIGLVVCAMAAYREHKRDTLDPGILVIVIVWPDLVRASIKEWRKS